MKDRKAAQTRSTALAQKGMLTDPGEHFIGKYEVEFKFRVRDLAGVRDQLATLNATPFALENEETDVFFDLEDNRLTLNGQSHVLRRMLPSDRVLWIVKGPAKDECVAMDLPEYAKGLEMLGALGFKEQTRIKKRRDIYFLDHSHVTLDDVDGLGTFVEVAAMTDSPSHLATLRQHLVDDISRLGLSQAARVQASYREQLQRQA